MPYGEQSVNSEQTGGETPPLQLLGFVRRGRPKAPPGGSLEVDHRSPTVPAKSNTVGGHSICPRCMEFHSNNRRRTLEPALCKGRCREKRGGGVVPDKNYLLFLPANFRLLQSLRRCRASSLYWGVPWSCANIAGMYLAPCKVDHRSSARRQSPVPFVKTVFFKIAKNTLLISC